MVTDRPAEDIEHADEFVLPTKVEFTLNFPVELGRQLRGVSAVTREGAFLFQRLPVAIQRFNSVRYFS